MSVMKVESVDVKQNLVRLANHVCIGYEHFCQVADAPPTDGDWYEFQGSIEFGGQITSAVKLGH
jgi:hypothetical protein